MKIFFLIQRYSKPSSRYRVLQFLPALKEAGFETEVAEVSGRWWSRRRTLKKAQTYPIVFIQKKLFRSMELRMLQAKKARLVYDFDDAIMFRHKPKPGEKSRTRSRQFAAMMQCCEIVLAGNTFLEAKAREKTRKVVVLPTCVDIARYRVKENWSGTGSVTLGWLGSPSTLQYLEAIMPALEEVAQHFPHVQLKVVSSVFPKENKKIKIIRKEWKEVEEEKDLHSFDIGLAPLNDDLWCEGKCGLKLLQYMACGLPTVSSPFGAQKDIIQDALNGFRAKSIEDWVDKLTKLILDVQKREDLGLLARKTVEERYSLDRAKQTILKVLHELSD